MTINCNTRISALLKFNPDALEAIVSLSPRFEKLRNPILRKIMAARTTISMAAKMGGCSKKDFFRVLIPLGFKSTEAEHEAGEKQFIPDFITTAKKESVITLDVRPVISGGEDPLSIIMGVVNSLKPGEILKIINTFEPAPLVALLEKKGFESYSEHINNNLVETWFHKKDGKNIIGEEVADYKNFKFYMDRFRTNLKEIDVRHLEMPAPMITILETLGKLKEGQALFVHHKRVPVFLIPELKERGYSLCVNESVEDVQLIIFKD